MSIAVTSFEEEDMAVMRNSSGVIGTKRKL